MTSFANSVRYQVEDAVATITFDRPEARNAFDQVMAESLLAALVTARKDDAVRVIVITGRGKAFSAGQDIHELAAKEAEIGARAAGDELRLRFNPILLEMRANDKPIIASINGVTTGAGLGIALASDLRIAGMSASFVCAPHGIALIPGAGATWLLPRIVGVSAANDLLLLGARVDAERALDLGIVSWVVSDDDLAEQTRTVAERLLQLPDSSLRLTKRASNRSLFDGYEKHLAYEADLQEVAASQPAHTERLRAMIDKGSNRQ